MSRTKRATWTYATTVIFTLVTMVTGLYASPRITEWIGGPEPFGYYRAATDLGGFIMLLELGLSGGMMSLLSQAVGRGDQDEIRATLAAGIRLASKICLLMLLTGWAMAFGLPYLGQIGLKPIAPRYLRDVQIGFALSVLGCLTFPVQPFRALIEARQRGYLINVLIISQSLLITALALTFAYSGGGITGQFLANLIGLLMLPVAITWQGHRQYPGVFRQALTQPIPEELHRSIRSQNRASMILNICGRLSLYTDSLFIVALVDEGSVTRLYFTSALANMAKTQLMSVGSAVWAGLAELRLRGEFELFARRFFEINRLLVIFGLTVLLPITAYNQDFTRLWMRKFPVYAGDGAMLVITANALLIPFVSLWGWLFQGLGRIPRMVPASIVATVLNLILTVIATRTLGLVGPILGTLATMILYQSWKLPLLMRQEFDLSPRELARSILPGLLLGLPVGLLLWFGSRAFPAQDWLGLILKMGTASLVYPVLAWFLILDANERVTWIARARPILSRFLPFPEVLPVGQPETLADGGLIEVEGPPIAPDDDAPSSPRLGP